MVIGHAIERQKMKLRTEVPMVVDISNYKDLNYYKGKKTILIPDAVDRKNKK